MYIYKIHIFIDVYDIIIKYDKLYYKCTFIIKLHQILLHNNIVIFNYNMSNFKIYLILKL